jgi:hypothetical protein
MIIRKEISRKSYSDIAFLLDRSVEETTTIVNELAKDIGMIPYQQVLDEKRKELKMLRPAKEPKIRKPREQKKKEPVIISRIVEKPGRSGRSGGSRQSEPRRYKAW